MDPRTANEYARSAVLYVRRIRGDTLAAPGAREFSRTSQRTVRQGLGQAARGDARETEESWHRAERRQACRPAGRSKGVGRSNERRKTGSISADGKLR